MKNRDKATNKTTWTRRGADSIAALYLDRTSNLHRILLAESDSLFLTRDQITRLLAADSVYSARVRELYVPLGQFLAAQPDGAAGKAALDSVQTTTRLYWPIFWEQVDIAQEIVNTQQRELMPMFNNMTGVTKQERLRAQWTFGYPVPLVHNRPRVGGQPGSTNTSVTR